MIDCIFHIQSSLSPVHMLSDSIFQTYCVAHYIKHTMNFHLYLFLNAHSFPNKQISSTTTFVHSFAVRSASLISAD